MPKLAPIALGDLAMGEVHGTAGKSRPCGMYLHRYVIDVSAHTPQTTEDFNIFEPAAAARPIMIVYASFTWVLGSTDMDNAEVSMGGDAGVSDLLQATPIDQSSNGDVFGWQFGDPGTLSLLIRIQGASNHAHWEKALSSFAGGDPTIGLPVKLRIESGPATANPYSGTITAHILWVPLRAF